MSTVKLHKLEGEAYEAAYLKEFQYFRGKVENIRHEDLVAALILKDECPTNKRAVELLRNLYDRKIRAAVGTDEDSTFYDLEFETQ